MKPQKDTSTEPVTTSAPPGLEKGAIAGITVAVIIGVILLTGIFVLCWFPGKCMWRKREEQREPVPAVRYTAAEQQCAEGQDA
ncbi:hypothetical protein NDU88_010587 [Pleurodeles waltl]|uniref:Uncharacterized protein n=1 Tax=Pleurodeles waltl TaxID=8319 RepID=A0AAV7PVA9_PLEWA|nr:hypothetical protein NDU88_010587 [Pleurodeles waltl]